MTRSFVNGPGPPEASWPSGFLSNQWQRWSHTQNGEHHLLPDPSSSSSSTETTDLSELALDPPMQCAIHPGE